MRLGQRLERLESGQGSAVRIAGWCDSSWVPFEPSAEFRAFVEQEACRMQVDDVDWRWAVYLQGETSGDIVLLLGEAKRFQVIEVGTHKPWAES